MKTLYRVCALLTCWLLPASLALADSYGDTIAVFRNAGQSAAFFRSSYGYAVFPTIGKGGFFVGAAHGTGQVYQQGRLIGEASMTQVSVGLQLGGQAYSEIVFFENRAALDRFESGHLALSADASAVAVTAAASASAGTASAGTAGTGASASASEDVAKTAGHYQDGVAVFTVAKGGLMYQAAVAGQKFSYSPAH